MADAALEAIEFQTDASFIVFGLSDPLGPTDELVANDLTGISANAPVDIAAPSCFFYVDDAPLALFDHPTRFVLVDPETREVSISQHSSWPLVNGVAPWAEDDTYWTTEDWVVASSDAEEYAASYAQYSAETAARPGLTVDPNVLGRGPTLSARAEGRSVAVVINGWREGQNGQRSMEIDAEQMSKVAESAGFDPVLRMGPLSDPTRTYANTSENLDLLFDQLSEELADGDELLLYLGGHGNAGRPPLGAYAGGHFESELAESLAKFDPCVDIVVVIMSCESGAFIDGLEDVADLVLTSSAADRLTVTGRFNPIIYGVGTGFTSALISSLGTARREPDMANAVEVRRISTGTGYMVAWFAEAFEQSEWSIVGWYYNSPQLKYGTGPRVDYKECDPIDGNTSGGDDSNPEGGEDGDSGDSGDEEPGPSGDEEPGPSDDDDARRLAELFMELFGVLDRELKAVESGNETEHSDGEKSATAEDEVDIIGWNHTSVNLDAEQLSGLGCENPDVVCAYETLIPQPGDYHLLTMQLDGTPPTGDTGQIHQYALVLDSDGNRDNNYVPDSAYPLDFFANTDRWLTVDHYPGSDWSLSAYSDPDGGLVTISYTATRVIMFEDFLIFVLPADELESAQPEGRFTAFRHTGDYGDASPWSGDVFPAVGEPLLDFDG